MADENGGGSGAPKRDFSGNSRGGGDGGTTSSILRKNVDVISALDMMLTVVIVLTVFSEIVFCT